MPIEIAKYAVRTTGSRWDRLSFRLEHALLSPGRSDAARLRGYLRVKRWRDCATIRERLHQLMVVAKLPARAVRDSWRAVRIQGAVVEREAGVSRFRQFLHLCWLWVRHGVNQPAVYYGFGLYRPGQLRRGPLFLQGAEDDELFRLLNVREALDESELLLDKAAFERWLVERSFPTTKTLVEFADGAIVRSTVAPGELPPRDLFLKPNDSLQGNGTESWRFDGEGWTGPRGRRDARALVEELTELSRGRSLILQEKLLNHPALAPLAPAALSTVRVMTIRALAGDIRVVATVAKIPTGDAPTDHLRFGGIAAPVDLSTGRLGRGVRKHETLVVESCTHHPDTGVPLEGFALPLWDQVLALAVSVHKALPTVLCVGWDVAVLPEGPIILEGNDNPGHMSSQLPTGVALGETIVLPTLRARLDSSFRAGEAISRDRAQRPRPARDPQPGDPGAGRV